MSEDVYERLSRERKEGQHKGLYPEWFTTGGYQLFTSKYAFNGESFRGASERISRAASDYLPESYRTYFRNKFFELIWNGWLSCSTPVLANLGTPRGMAVSCSGGFIDDSIDSFYAVLRETAILTKNGFGTAGYLGAIRPRGSPISVGGKASGVLPVIRDFVEMSRNVSQGSQRRGAWAGYLPIDHGDFDEVVNYLEQNPDDLNIGWCIPDSFISDLNAGDLDATARYQKALKVKMVTGKGYFFFPDKANAKRPEWYVKHGLDIKSSQLCNEIMLHSSSDYTYTCVLSSLNLAKYDEWKGTNAAYIATIFLDCVAEDFIQRGKQIPGLERAVSFTEKGRALGLGVCGFHTLLQRRNIAFESLEATYLNNEVFKQIRSQAEQATTWMAKTQGSPAWCEGYERRNTHLLAIAPTKSTALIMGGVSEGINPDPAMTFTQMSAAGEIDRITPVLLELMKKKGVYNKKTIQDIVDHSGSVQHVGWLNENEKVVFKTAFEINQEAVLRLASQRARYLDQWQSLNLFFSAEEDEEWISHIHRQAFEDPNILGLYYCYSKSGVKASRECEACQ